MADDVYKTVKGISEGFYSEKRSKFISYAIPVKTVEDVKLHIDELRQKYYDSRHVCWAYVLGANRELFRSNDDGEPSSTAGKPILGQINSNELTDILVVVVRYFGGTNLGTPGLIRAYRTAAAEAIALGEIEERTVNIDFAVCFEYFFLNGIMRIVKEENPAVLSRQFDTNCKVTLRIRKSEADKLKSRLLKIDTVRISDL